MAGKIDKDKCVGCGICVGECPVEAIEIKDDGKAEIDPDKCISCGTCAGACPNEAISVE